MRFAKFSQGGLVVSGTLELQMFAGQLVDRKL